MFHLTKISLKISSILLFQWNNFQNTIFIMWVFRWHLFLVREVFGLERFWTTEIVPLTGIQISSRAKWMKYFHSKARICFTGNAEVSQIEVMSHGYHPATHAMLEFPPTITGCTNYITSYLHNLTRMEIQFVLNDFIIKRLEKLELIVKSRCIKRLIK